MRRVVNFGYDKEGEFFIGLTVQEPGMATVESQVFLLRSECAKISKHMQFGKKGDERHMETVNGREIK
jgi:hypothetical protein